MNGGRVFIYLSRLFGPALHCSVLREGNNKYSFSGSTIKWWGKGFHPHKKKLEMPLLAGHFGGATYNIEQHQMGFFDFEEKHRKEVITMIYVCITKSMFHGLSELQVFSKVHFRTH